MMIEEKFQNQGGDDSLRRVPVLAKIMEHSHLILYNPKIHD
jgi:hypothetical protein